MKNVKEKLIEIKQVQDGQNYITYQPVDIIDRDSLTEEERKILDEKYNAQMASQILSYKFMKNLHMRFQIRKEVAKGTCTDYRPTVHYALLWTEREYLLQLKKEISEGSIEAMQELINKYNELG